MGTRVVLGEHSSSVRLLRRDKGYGWLPLGHLNLRRNPFGELDRAERLQAAVVDTEPWVAFVATPRRALQFLGPCGHGKSSHLYAMIRDCGLDLSAYIYLPPRRSIPDLWSRRMLPFIDSTQAAGWGCAQRLLEHKNVLVLDEAQRLPLGLRKRVFRSHDPVLLGTHADLSPALRRAGFEVMTVDVSRQCDPQRIADVLNRRIALSRLDAAVDFPHCSLDEAQRLHARYGSDLRAIESRLYDVFQQLAGTTHGEVRFSD